MKAARSDGGYIFHGGCNGCTQPLKVCPTCCYMEPDWSLPNKNPAAIKAANEREVMKKHARLAMENA